MRHVTLLKYYTSRYFIKILYVTLLYQNIIRHVTLLEYYTSRYFADPHFDTLRGQHPTSEHEADNAAPSLPTTHEQPTADPSACVCSCVRRTRSFPRATNNRGKSGRTETSGGRIQFQDMKHRTYL